MPLTLEVTEIGIGETQMRSADAAIKAGTRELDFYAAAFNSMDTHGSILDAKAFDAWLPKFYGAGQALKLSFNHAAILDDTDPTNVIGYASADPQHVWVDDFGLRISGVLNTSTEKGKAVEWQVEQGLLKGASLAFEFSPENVQFNADNRRIMSVDSVLEAGLVPHPANQAAVLLGMKSQGMGETDMSKLFMSVSEFKEVMNSQPKTVQDWHDALIAQGAECEHVTPALASAAEALETPQLLTPEDEARLRHLRFMEATEI